MTENSKKRNEIIETLKKSCEKCERFYKDVKILASHTDPQVVAICNMIHDAFLFGIKDFSSTILKNVQEALDISLLSNNNHSLSTQLQNQSITFWNFCERNLIPHEKERYDKLKNVWTDCGKSKAFIRSCLNESSLQRYISIFIEDEYVTQFYEPWSILLDENAQIEFIGIAKVLGPILFALNIDTPDLNSPHVTKYASTPTEPVINAPIPISKSKKSSPVEREIATSPEFPEINDILEKTRNLQVVAVEEPVAKPFMHYPEIVYGERELPTFPVESEFAMENEHSSVFSPITPNETTIYEDCEEAPENDVDQQAEVSSVSSKGSSSTKNSSVTQVFYLNEKLREMQERITLLETRVAELSLENRRLRRLTNYTNRDSGHCLVTIPYAKRIINLHRKYYIYEIHITMPHTLEKWSVSKRYSDFYDLNEKFKKTSPNNLEFPPKKHFGNLKNEFVEERRQLLQVYIRNLLDLWPGLDKCQTREDLEEVFPFFKE